MEIVEVEKSSLIGLLIGLIKPDAGEIEIDGNNVYNEFDNFQKVYGYVSQENFY